MDEIPAQRRYTSDHEWITDSGDGEATIGITHYAQNSLGDITFVELPEVGAVFEKADSFGVVESVKAASDLYMPISAEVIEINAELETAPELINQAPYEGGWLVRVRIKAAGEISDLLTAEAYAELV